MATQRDSASYFRQDDFSAIVSQRGHGSATVTLTGEFDLSTAADLRECFVAREVLDADRVEVDLAGVRFFDSSSIGLLVGVCKRVRSAGGAFSVRCDEGVARQILKGAGLVDYFEVDGRIDSSCAIGSRGDFVGRD